MEDSGTAGCGTPSYFHADINKPPNHSCDSAFCLRIQRPAGVRMNRRIQLIAACSLLTALANPSFAQLSPSGGNTRHGATPAPTQPEKPAATGRTIDLRPKFIKGKETRLKMECISTDKPVDRARGKKTPEQPEPQNIKVEIGLLLKVKDSNPETGATVEVRYETFKLAMTGPMGEIEFDSTKPRNPGRTGEKDMIGEFLRPITEATTTVEFDQYGNFKSASGGGAGNQAGGLGALTGGLTGGDLLKSLFGPVAGNTRNNGRASIGESWTSESVMDAPGGNWKITSTQTLRSASGSQATIDIKGKVGLDPASSGAGSGAKISDGSYSGKAIWNTELGIIDQMETKMSLKVELPAALSGESSSEQPAASIHEMSMRVNRIR